MLGLLVPQSPIQPRLSRVGRYRVKHNRPTLQSPATIFAAVEGLRRAPLLRAAPVGGSVWHRNFSTRAAESNLPRPLDSNNGSIVELCGLPCTIIGR